MARNRQCNIKPEEFFNFVLEFKEKMIKRGNEIPDIKKLADMAKPHWEKLSLEDKQKYKNNSQSSSRLRNNEESTRLKAERKANELMVNFIKNLVIEACDSGELRTKVFYFVTTSSFYSSSADIYPAEIAIAKFSLSEGIIDDFQIHINPGNLPLGSSLKAFEKSQATHKYPLTKCDGEQDYLKILEGIVTFLQPLERLPIFFTDGNTRDDLEQMLETCRIIKKIFYESHEDEMLKHVKVYPIDELFFMLQKVIVTRRNCQNNTSEALFPSITHASNIIKEERHGSKIEGCKFHNEKRVTSHCCLYKVRRFCCTISNFCS